MQQCGKSLLGGGVAIRYDSVIVKVGTRLKLRRIINGPKTVTDWGKWKVGEKSPPSAYPLSKNKYHVTAKYTWRVIKFDCLAPSFRLLVCFRADLSRFQCHLGKVDAGDMVTLARYEFHPGEPGWHIHCACDDTGRVSGTMRCDDKRFPHPSSFHRVVECGELNEKIALDKAKEIFRLYKAPPFELVGQK